MMTEQDIPRLETERLILRAPRESDFGAYVSFFSDQEASKYYGGPLPEYLVFRKLAGDIGHWVLKGFGVWTLECLYEGAIVGSCGLYWPEGWPRRELTWWINPEARRKGFAVEASRAAINYGYDVLNWDFVETHMDDGNTAAASLAQKLGGEIYDRIDFPDGQSRNLYRLPPQPTIDT